MEEELIRRSALPFETIPAAGVHGVGWRRLPGNLVALAKGYGRSRQIVRHFRPEVLFFTGGYLAVPVALAGRRVPTLLYVPDIEPGLALKTIARFADQVAITVEGTRRFIPPRTQVTVTGYPTRPGLATWSKEAARESLGLVEQVPVLLAFGGSHGARSINRALAAALPVLLPEMQVIHITGQFDWEEIQQVQKSLPGRLAEEGLSSRYHPYPYLHEQMGAALAAADLALARAGASVLGEFPLFGLPAILVPYPYAWQYQQTNAAYLSEHGAAVVIQDEHLPQQLSDRVLQLVRDAGRRQKMRQSMQALAQPGAAQAIAGLLWKLSGVTGPGKERSR